MRLTTATMYDRFMAGDPAYNGRFFPAVVTTGVYCLPSCKARKPRPENVRFFPSCDAAREAGFRACRKCHPDDFARGADPVLETIETVVAELRAAPAAFPDAAALVRRSGFGTTRFFELLRQHYHATPADMIVTARLASAKAALLGGRASLLEVAAEAGFESASVFYAHFRERCGMSPAAYRDLPSARSFAIELPEGYPLPYLRRALSRDSQSVTERLSGDTYETAVRMGEASGWIRMRFHGAGRVAVEFGPCADSTPIAAEEVHSIVAGLIGLDYDGPGFARLAKRLGFARLVQGREGLRICRTPTVFDGLLWAIVGQQINFPFACTLKRRLVELAGEPLENGLFAPPTPKRVAELDPEALKPLQFSRQKADYLIGAASLAACGKIDLEGLKSLSATRAERILSGVRGLGPWSINYLMMRSLGFHDCVPLGDTGVTSGLQALFSLDERPAVDATRRLMAIFSPYRSLATNHLWNLLKSPP